jgi:hypothetical protein
VEAVNTSILNKGSTIYLPDFKRISSERMAMQKPAQRKFAKRLLREMEQGAILDIYTSFSVSGLA